MIQETFPPKLDIRSWPGEIPLTSRYTVGAAGEVFLRELKSGRMMAIECPKCKTSQLPPKTFCERCFSRLEKWVTVELPGHIRSFTWLHEDIHGKPLASPQCLAFIEFKNVTGGIIHYVGEVSKTAVVIGLSVTPVFKPESERNASMLDIQYFKKA